MILSTTTIPQQYDVLDVIVVHVIGTTGMLGTKTIDPIKLLDETKTLLAEKARGAGGDAVIGIDFDQVWEHSGSLSVFAYGTVVKIK